MSLSDISDLTELSSEEDAPTARPTPKSRKQSKEYKIKNVLRAPRTTQYTTKSLYDQIIDNAIDLDPEYQRDVVWSDEKQSGLVDSILRNYYMPPIIFAVSFQDDGSERRTCIDGKQRLTSIQKFLDGQIPHKDSFTNEKLWYKSSAQNPRRKLLPQQLRTLFANKQVVCVEYSDLTDNQEREIFQRVQLGVALTPAERLQAIVGPWPSLIRDIQSHILGEDGLEGYLNWGHARGRDFQCLATIGYLIENSSKPGIPTSKVLEKWLHQTDPVRPTLVADLQETFRIFVMLARDKQYSSSLNSPARVSPIEFVMIGILIYKKRASLSLTQLTSAIEKMRKDVRASEKDIRANSRVTKLMMDFINKRLKVSELKKDGEGDRPASIIARSVKPSAKRKRPAESSDEESEAESPPPRKVTTGVSAKAGSDSSRQSVTKKSTSPVITTATAVKRSADAPATRSGRLESRSTMASQKPLPPPLRIPAARSTQAAVPTPTQDKAVTPAIAAPQIPKTSISPTTNQPAPPSSTPMTALKPPPPLPVSAGPPPTPTRENAPQSSLHPVTKAESVGPSLPTADPRLQSSSVHSPLANATADRLAPIRAAKAALLGSSSGRESPSGVNLGVVNGVGSGPQGAQDFRAASRSSTPQQPPIRNAYSSWSQPSQAHADVPQVPQDLQRLPPQPSHIVQQASLNHTQDSFGRPYLLTEETSANFSDARNGSHHPRSPLFYQEPRPLSPVSHRHPRAQHQLQQQSGSVPGHGPGRPPLPLPPSSARSQQPPPGAYAPRAHTGANTLPPRPPPEVRRASTLPYPPHQLPPSGPYTESDRREPGSERRQSFSDQRASSVLGSGAYDYDRWDRDRVRDRDWNYPPPSRPRAERPLGRGRGRG